MMKQQIILFLCCMSAVFSHAQIYDFDNSIENVFLVTKEPTTEGLVAYYPFNRNANDESGNQNHGVVSGANLTIGCSGENNNAYQFGGQSNPGSIRVRNSSSLYMGDGWSFAAYVKPYSQSGMDGYGRNSSQGVHCILAHSHDRSGFCILYRLEKTQFCTWLGSCYKTKCSGVSAHVTGCYLNQWVHVAYVFNKNEFRVFINGQRITTKQVVPNFSTANRQDWYLGKYSDSWYPMNGALDEVRIYNRALSDDEVAGLIIF